MEQRRMNDPDRIEDMIAQESDPKDRAFLLILNNINKALVANTETIREVADKLETHIQRFENHTDAEEAMLNQGRGAWRVAAWVIGVVQVIGLAVWIDSRKEISEIHIAQHEAAIRHADHESRLKTLERK